MSYAVDRRAVPDEATALLTVKIGDVSRTSRKHLTILTFSFMLSEGIDVFRAKVDACTDKALSSFRGERHVREDGAIYMRPGAHSKQAELVEINSSNFESRVARSYKNYLKRKTHEPFQCEVYVYVKKVVPPRRRRLEANSSLAGKVEPHCDVGHTQRVASEQLASGSAVLNDVPGLKRKRSIGSDEEQEAHQAQQLLQTPVIDEYYRTVRMVVNGAVVPVQVNVQDLFACLAPCLHPQTQFKPTCEETFRDPDHANL
ncbi:hypothetical protein PsorP6_000556 [Peronosclerospora sorghi]|uniref:Uncharacterized protein n=1 Tax=Peronosclerospora sorghi TaxID=230839 RepID=A0ACC0WPR6_9STRA|nr:hypothetical protein PsorP6_000556 [Peronosclerospora sorghi]